jgi:lysocardiolipin and lysophospholipid acyltransferase
MTQVIGAPLYWINRDLYYSYMALTKKYFALVTTSMTQIWGPTVIRISGDASMAGQMRKASDGRVEFSFPERMVMIANHQVCSFTPQSLQDAHGTIFHPANSSH